MFALETKNRTRIKQNTTFVFAWKYLQNFLFNVSELFLSRRKYCHEIKNSLLALRWK